MQLVFFWTHLTVCVVSLAAIRFVFICTPITFFMGHMSLFDMFFSGNGCIFYLQTTAVNSAWFVNRYFDQHAKLHPGGGGALKGNRVVTRKQKNAGKGSFLRIVIVCANHI